jgi:hypothetical protein
MSIMNRRVFLGSAAGAGAIALGGVIAPPVLRAQGSGSARGRATPEGAVLSELYRQIVAATNSITRGPSGEPLRQVAAANRIFAEWGREQRLDARVRAQVRNEIGRRGRAALIVPAFDVVEELKIRGFDVPPGAAMTVTPARMSALLDQAQSHAGLMSTYTNLSERIEARALKIDTRLGVRPIAWQEEDECTLIRGIRDILEALVLFWCAPWMAGWYEVCIIVAADLAFWMAYQWIAGCG